MRFVSSLLLLILAVPAIGQERIFRADPIDLKQDARLDALESRIETLVRLFDKSQPEVAKSVLEDVPKPIDDPVPNAEKPSSEKRYCLGDVKYCEGRLHYLACIDGVEKWVPVPLAAQAVAMATMTYSQPVVVSATTAQRSVATVSGRYSMSELRSLIQQYRNHRIYADVQPRSYAYSHLVQDHGFSSDQVNGLSLDEAYRLHSLAHGGIVRAYRSGASVAIVQASVQSAPVYSYATPVQPIRTPVRTVVQAAASGCANGRCPLPSRSGYSLFGRFR